MSSAEKCLTTYCTRKTKNKSGKCWQHEGKSDRSFSTETARLFSNPSLSDGPSNGIKQVTGSPWENQDIVTGRGVAGRTLGVHSTSYGHVAIIKIDPAQEGWDTNRQPYAEFHTDELSTIDGTLQGHVNKEYVEDLKVLEKKVFKGDASVEETRAYKDTSRRLSNCIKGGLELHHAMLMVDVPVNLRDGRQGTVSQAPTDEVGSIRVRVDEGSVNSEEVECLGMETYIRYD